MTGDNKITTGANDRPKSDSIAKTGPRIPGYSGAVVDVDERRLDAMRAALGVEAHQFFGWITVVVRAARLKTC